jgi:hypothetical protein
MGRPELTARRRQRVFVANDEVGWHARWFCRPTTGNLAVANGANVLVYAHARGKPRKYSDTLPVGVYYVGYDGSGNLFADGAGDSYKSVLIELPKGKTEFKNIRVNPSTALDGAGDVQWDGKYMVLANYNDPTTMYQFSIAGSKATLEGTTTLEFSAPLLAFWITRPVMMEIYGARRLLAHRFQTMASLLGITQLVADISGNGVMAPMSQSP